jgi:hypothetical protein
MGGSIGGMLAAPATGIWLDYRHKSCGPLFIWAGYGVSDRVAGDSFVSAADIVSV